MSDLDANEVALVTVGRKIDAIKAYRNRTGAGLIAAKDAVEHYEQTESFRERGRRLRACEAACAGVPTEALEAGALGALVDAAARRHRLDRSVVYRDEPDGRVSLVGGSLDLRKTVGATSAVNDALRALGRLP